MERLGIILDVTLSDESLDQAMDLFGGTVWASHCNCRALVPGDRQLSDEQLKRVIERDGVIGAAFDAWMLIPGWQRGVTTPESSGVVLSHVVDHIDYVYIGTPRRHKARLHRHRSRRRLWPRTVAG